MYGTTLSVPHKKVGLVIGRGGENIRFLQQQTRAHIQIQAESFGNSERLVCVRGTRDACAEAGRMIQDMIDGLLHIGTARVVPPQARPTSRRFPYDRVRVVNADPKRHSPSSLSAHPPLSIPVLDAFQLRF